MESQFHEFVQGSDIALVNVGETEEKPLLPRFLQEQVIYRCEDAKATVLWVNEDVFYHDLLFIEWIEKIIKVFFNQLVVLWPDEPLERDDIPVPVSADIAAVESLEVEKKANDDLPSFVVVQLLKSVDDRRPVLIARFSDSDVRQYPYPGLHLFQRRGQEIEVIQIENPLQEKFRRKPNPEV